jgi:hypothetical protein
MKILQVCPIFPPRPKEVGAGVTQVVYNMSKEFARRGHEVEVYTSNALDMERFETYYVQVYFKSWSPKLAIAEFGVIATKRASA